MSRRNMMIACLRDYICLPIESCKMIFVIREDVQRDFSLEIDITCAGLRDRCRLNALGPFPSNLSKLQGRSIYTSENCNAVQHATYISLHFNMVKWLTSTFLCFWLCWQWETRRKRMLHACMMWRWRAWSRSYILSLRACPNLLAEHCCRGAWDPSISF